MTARILAIAPLLLAPAFLLHGQQAGINGPVSGYVFDSAAHGLRPILGMPGGSLIGGPLDFRLEVAAAYVTPRQDGAFVTASDGSFHWFRISGGAASELTLNGVTGAPRRIVYSPSGTAAVLYIGTSVEIVTGLPDAPAVAGGPSVNSIAGPDSLAVSDDGAVMLMASGDEVELFGGAADLGRLTNTSGSALVAFASGGHDAVVVDRAGAGVVLFRDLTGATQSQVLAAPDATIGSASAVAFSIDGQRLLLASSVGQSVTTLDLTAGSRTDVACACAPSALVRVGNLFRLNELGNGPLWLLDAQPAAATIAFVPAAANESNPRSTGIGLTRTPRPVANPNRAPRSE